MKTSPSPTIKPKRARRPGRPAGARIFAAVLAAALLASCAGMSGGAYERSAESDSSAAAVAAQRKKDTPPPSQPRTPPAPESGTSGFLFFGPPPPPPPRGWITVRGLPPGATLYVDDRPYSGGSAEVEAGDRLVEVRAFGYEPWSARVTVRIGESVELEAGIFPAVFRLTELGASPPSFDPGAPGALGRIRLEWTVTAPGRGDLEIRDAQGRTVFAARDIELDSAYGDLAWDGRDGSGRAAAPGVYYARLSAAGRDGSASSLETSVELSPEAAPQRFSGLHGGFSGALFAPDARVLPEGSFQAAAGTYLLSTPQGADSAARMPAFAGIRAGGLFGGRSELVASGMLVPYFGFSGADPSWGSLMVSVKTTLAAGPHGAAAFLASASVASFLDEASSGFPPAWDGPARYPGLGAGLVLEASTRTSRVFASLHAHASTYYPDWDDLEWDTPGLFAWAYGRAGAEALISGVFGGDLALALSAAARTEPFGGVSGFRPPLSVGAEAHWYAPESGLVLSAYAAGEWAAFKSWYYAGGFGVGFAF